MNTLEKLNILENEILKAQDRINAVRDKIRTQDDRPLENGALKRQMMELCYVWRRDLNSGSFLTVYNPED